MLFNPSSFSFEYLDNKYDVNNSCSHRCQIRFMDIVYTILWDDINTRPIIYDNITPGSPCFVVGHPELENNEVTVRHILHALSLYDYPVKINKVAGGAFYLTISDFLDTPVCDLVVTDISLISEMVYNNMSYLTSSSSESIDEMKYNITMHIPMHIHC